MFLTDSISMGGDWDTIWRLTAPTSYLIPVMCAVHIGAFFGRAGVGGRGGIADYIQVQRQELCQWHTNALGQLHPNVVYGRESHIDPF